jgi:hypothetical protein
LDKAVKGKEDKGKEGKEQNRSNLDLTSEEFYQKIK